MRTLGCLVWLGIYAVHPAGWFFAVLAALGGGLVLRVTGTGAGASQDRIWSSRSRIRRGLVMYLPFTCASNAPDHEAGIW
jgi:hypothetical protein